ncbi:MAG TPA: 50S ribosomal protein L7/L12 [Anaerolineae bacterium]|nr:50S ribosomal protein L7/L12 [Anaerolineae bacterium]HMR65028.1 50S ribosomal protein L7/L12 [Anaerolineae bacterium]
MADIQKIAEELSSLTVLEAAELTKLLEEKWGVSASAPAAFMAAPMAGAAGGGGEAAAPEEEKTEFDVVLKDVGAKKIQVIKAVRTVRSDLGLKEAKDLVDSAPAKVLEAASKEAAADAKAKLEAEGAVVEIV